MIETTEWESNDVRLVRLDGLPRSTHFPAGSETRSRYIEVPGRVISELIVHHSAGNLLQGSAAPLRIAEYHSAPRLRDPQGHVIGGGRGWPGGAYTYVVPAMPEVREGRLVVYRCWPDEWVTWHTGRGHNSRGVGVCVAGHYYSRHAPRGGGEPRPDDTAMAALLGLIEDYLLPRHGLTWADVLGHFDCGKPTCPGDALEGLVRTRRGEPVVDFTEPEGRGWVGPLDTPRQRQEALSRLGMHLGAPGVDGVWGELSRGALEAYQLGRHLRADGVWGPVTERRVRLDLAALG